MIKSTYILRVSLLALFLAFSGCKFLTEGKQKLAHYCPGLQITNPGITYAYSDGKGFYVFDYDQSAQGDVKTYFEKKENGFAEEKDGDFYNIKLDDKPVIDRADNILGKTFKHAQGNTEVVFNETTRRIIIIENSD
jgi:hypothetical protein